MRKHMLLVIACLFLVTGFTRDARADLIISYKLKDSRGMISSMKISLSGDAIRLDYSGLPYSISMVHRKDGSFLLIDHEKSLSGI